MARPYRGNTQRWIHNIRNVENPWLAADRKAKRLAELLKDVAPNEKARKDVPFLQSKVVLHGHGCTVELEERATLGVLAMDKFEIKAKPALTKVSTFLAELPSNPHHVVDYQRAKAVRALCDKAGFRAAPKVRMVGDYKVADSTPSPKALTGRTCWSTTPTSAASSSACASATFRPRPLRPIASASRTLLSASTNSPTVSATTASMCPPSSRRPTTALP